MHLTGENTTLSLSVSSAGIFSDGGILGVFGGILDRGILGVGFWMEVFWAEVFWVSPIIYQSTNNH